MAEEGDPNVDMVFPLRRGIMSLMPDAEFIRFVAAESHPTVRGAELGMFSALRDIDFDQQPRSIQRAHEEAWYWFSPAGAGSLTYPRLTGKARTHAVRKSLFWFRSRASIGLSKRGSMIDRTRQLADVMTQAGFEVREIETDDPGTIVWEDFNQVLARPTGVPLRAF